MTAQETYTIKDAAKKVQVEAHVLRYWEEELKLPIGRNEQGHRFYTEKDVELLGHVREWKQQGLQLKAIRLMLSKDGRLAVPQEVVRQVQSMVETGAAQPPAAEAVAAPLSIEAILLDERSAKAAKLQLLLENLVSRTVQESNEVILKELSASAADVKEDADEDCDRINAYKKRRQMNEHLSPF